MSFHGQPALVIGNDKLELKVLSFGGALVSLKLKGDSEKMNPLWDSFSLRHRGRQADSSGRFGRSLRLRGWVRTRVAGGARGGAAGTRRGPYSALGDAEFLEAGQSSELVTGRYSYRGFMKY